MPPNLVQVSFVTASSQHHQHHGSVLVQAPLVDVWIAAGQTSDYFWVVTFRSWRPLLVLWSFYVTSTQLQRGKARWYSAEDGHFGSVLVHQVLLVCVQLRRIQW
jgi:hypothetical protein